MRRAVSVATSIVAAAVLVGVAGAAADAAGGSPSLHGGNHGATASPSADLAVSGSIAGGERSVETFHPVVFVFNLTNNGPNAITSSADLTYSAVRNGTVSDQLCIFPSGASFNPDSPSCEFGTLRVGQTSRMTLIVQPDTGASGQPLSVRVCSSNESGVRDPVPSNNCLTLSVRLE